MKLRKIFEIQAANEINVRNGYTQTESQNADAWVCRLGYLAAVVGWDHDVNEYADSDSVIFDKIKKFAPNDHEYFNLTATYEIAGLIATNGPVKMGG